MVKIRVLYFIIIIKSEVRPIYHCLGLGHETMVCGVCLLSNMFVITRLIIIDKHRKAKFIKQQEIDIYYLHKANFYNKNNYNQY